VINGTGNTFTGVSWKGGNHGFHLLALDDLVVFNNNSRGDYRGRTENIFDRALGTKISNVGGAVVQYTLVDDTSMSFILRAVEKTQEGRVLQAPVVTVFNTQRANITLIDQVVLRTDVEGRAEPGVHADLWASSGGLALDVRRSATTASTSRPARRHRHRRPIPTPTTSLGASPRRPIRPNLLVQRAARRYAPDGGTVPSWFPHNINIRT
jgi:hypothetical protein